MTRLIWLIVSLSVFLPGSRSLILPRQFHRDLGISGINAAKLSKSAVLRLWSAEHHCRSSFSSSSARYAVPKRHLAPEPNRFVSILSTIASPVTRRLAYIQRAIFRFLVYHASAFMAAVLIDPGVNHGIATGIKDGMNLWLTQPNVKTKLLKLQHNLSSDERSLAKATGEDFPKVLINFLLGIVLQDFDPMDIIGDDDDDDR